ncbi:MAG TPA: N-acetylneuraminate synthase family protein [Candidatus Omnitrophota bacterium]|mgnify:CR=1 FL=1|nr:N-acetylneuraminate synthase family protein [Candidatus Omnitrophota bacterium]
MNSVQIGEKSIGDGFPAYVIAEIGINHNGSVSLAKEMLLAAWENGADAVKIQTFITGDFLHPKHPGYSYDINAEITHKKEQEIWDLAKKKKINLFSTPEEFRSLNFIQKQRPALIKIAAMDFNYKQLIQRAAGLQIPILLSSGMSTLAEVKRAVRWVRETGNTKYILLHCVSCYPAPYDACNLSVIKKMKETLHCPVGYSDHTNGTHIAFAAVTLGANVIEKHFTLSKKLPGPDQKCSMDPRDLKILISSIRDFELAVGHGRKEPAPQETQPRLYKRRGIYARKNLAAGSLLTQDQVVFFAPSSKESSIDLWESMSGKKLKKNIRKMEIIAITDVSS